MKIKEGKRYVRRDGTLSGVIEANPSICTGLDFPYKDEIETYSAYGEVWLSRQSEFDLIAEYKEQELKDIDFTKPLRCTSTDKSPVHYIGVDKDGKHVCQKTTGMEAIFIVDRFGKSAQFVDIENIPEKITRWVNMFTSSGYATKAEADMGYHNQNRIACIQVTFEPGEGL